MSAEGETGVILGMGTDVVEIHRIRQAYERYGERLLLRVLAPGELAAAARMVEPRRIEYLAGRFAAKEALAKAAGMGLGRLRMAAVEVRLTPSGLTAVWLDAGMAQAFAGEAWHVSIAHGRTVAVATAIRERRDGAETSGRART
ncbi:holo-[acyl-carrier-protein] synthase [Alicyclobacillus cellulosilyticus]|uniref:Holo-[acyl-carrier-protein] synthase n=1 Tax=Alicyclobacillus cellulosilyticus TaxID=1003997 RepID=A0A917K7K4_9BACL|nr:holo-ACP synthase [Alicyclobacillus cellulosilyticus]GGJ03996.1 holo-[acyl-carrier-protein] synthase [Alicyclobacillus cellulosilyticus]